MSSYTATSRRWTETTGSGGIEWIQVYSTNQTAVVENGKWKFTISAYVANDYHVDINYWSTNGVSSYINIYFYSDSARTKLIGSGSKAITGSLINSSGGKTGILATASATAAADVGTVYVTVELDCRGVNPPNGILYESQGYYINKMAEYGEFNVEDIPLTQAPFISGLVNVKKYNENSGISYMPRQIAVKWTNSGGAIDKSYYRLNGSGSWKETTGTLKATIDDLTPGTSYKVEIKSENTAGSSTANITIRTRHSIPVITAEYTAGLDFVKITWDSDKALENIQYKVGNGSWVTPGLSETNVINLSGLDPNSTYDIYLKGTSTATYDSLTSDTVSIQATTYDIAHITKIGDCIFGQNIELTIVNSSGNKINLDIFSGSAIFQFTNISLTNGKYTFIPNQSQLDQLYKVFTNSNDIDLYFKLYTVGSEIYIDSNKNKKLVLTGIAKTAHVGDSSGKPRRSQIWIGDSSGKPRRAVIWIGDSNNKPRRCI